eukprot:TRINITY_DN51866_c0_g1_i1.p1 TRINITY_DN51866_c0_g1~~TRINITY_DN51866_c0_g1_i1.p1  ORF type:complete len:268 (+),score=19.03 TRINITY_DN51866_c0_g1_i1:30-806(+)
METCAVCEGSCLLLQEICPLCDGDWETFFSEEGLHEVTRFFSEVLELPAVAQGLWAASGDPFLLAKLSSTRRSLRASISSPEFTAFAVADLLSQGVLWALRCQSLEEISLGMAVAKLLTKPSKNHLYFEYGGGTEVRAVTRPLLDETALLARRHPHIRVHIDSHVAWKCPSEIATKLSQERGDAVMNELMRRSLARERISVRAWGKRVSSVWSEPEDYTAARAELFCSLGGVQFPLREYYYDLVSEQPQLSVGAASLV